MIIFIIISIEIDVKDVENNDDYYYCYYRHHCHLYSTTMHPPSPSLSSSPNYAPIRRPQILVLTGVPETRVALVDLCSSITKGGSLMLCANVLEVLGRGSGNEY